MGEDDYKKCLREATPANVREIVEFVIELLRKQYPLTARQVDFVMANRGFLRHLIDPNYTVASKKRYLLKNGASRGLTFKSILTGIKGLFKRK